MKYAVVDISGLMHQARHTTGELSSKGQGTGIIFGVLSLLYNIKKTFPNHKMLLCYDSKVSKRKELFPDYKKKRNDRRTEEEKEELMLAIEQFVRMRREILPKIGFKNAFLQIGYEADDLIAQLCKDIHSDIVIVSRDKDLYQLLRPSVVLYDTVKKATYTHEDFEEEFGIPSKEWWRVKVIAGCNTDEVPGIKGVGEKTACQYLNGTLKSGSKKHTAIIENLDEVYKRNEPLVRLPFKGVQPMKIGDAKFNRSKFIQVCTELDFEFFLSKLNTWQTLFEDGI